MNIVEHKLDDIDGKQRLDALFVLSGGIKRVDLAGTFVPTGYEDSDPFGMMGGQIRAVAAASLSLKVEIGTVFFTTGVTEKSKEMYGSNIPSEASVYMDEYIRQTHQQSFLRTLAFKNLLALRIEDRSTTTMTNIAELLLCLTENPSWKTVGVLTSDYHVPRVIELIRKAARGSEACRGLDTEINLFSAEEVTKKLLPGIYDETIDLAYTTPEAVKRIENERRGVDDLRNQRYAVREFQIRD